MKYAKFAFLIFLLPLSMTSIGCNYAQEGTVNLYTQWGNIKQVYKSEDGWYTEILPGQASYVINTKSFTEKATAKVTSKDNAALQVEVAVTMRLSPEKAAEYAKKYGFDEAERHKRRNEILGGLIQTEARNAFAEHNAYDIYAQQESIQKRIIEAVKPQIATQLLLDVESVQMGNPDFLDDRIEQAASAVVANEKQKQAEEAKLNALPKLPPKQNRSKPRRLRIPRSCKSASLN